MDGYKPFRKTCLAVEGSHPEPLTVTYLDTFRDSSALWPPPQHSYVWQLPESPSCGLKWDGLGECWKVSKATCDLTGPTSGPRLLDGGNDAPRHF